MPVSHVQSQLDTKSAPMPGNRARLRVAVVDEELPFPATTGKRVRTLNLIRRLASRHEIAYICHRNNDPAETRRAQEYFSELGVETLVVDRCVPGKSGPTFYARLLANLFSPLPYSVTSHCSKELQGTIAGYGAAHPVDLWHCEWTPYAQLLHQVKGAPHVVMAHNVESLIWQRYYQWDRSLARRWYVYRQWMKFEAFERRALNWADQVVAVSQEDAALMKRRFGVANVEVVENGIDRAHFEEVGAERDPRTILFLGSLDWRPNLDAVGVLVREVFPAVVAVEPKARLQIVGRNPPQWLVRWVRATPNAELLANVPDVRPFLAQCAVLAVPLRIGGGSRIKILEALACGTPVVSTSVGAEGLRVQPDRHILLVGDVAAMAQALVRCLREPVATQRMGYEGRRFVLEEYDWDTLADRLEAVWIQAARCKRVVR